MPCTTILVGKNASNDGSTIIARNDDGGFEAKKIIVNKPEKQPRIYKTVISHLSVDLPEKALRYTTAPSVSTKNGVWPACGINEKNVAMTATETITSNPRVVGADPYVKYQPKTGRGTKEIPGGIGEEDLVTIVLPYIESAREGVLRLGMLLEKYGTYEANGIAFCDKDEAWWLDILVNNAADQGIGHGGPLEMDPDKILEVMGTNVRGGFQVTQAVCNRFFLKGKQKGERGQGVVVFLSSNTAQRAIRNRTAYCASKGAINSMVRSLALDLAPFGIRVNACAPGYIYTERWDVLDESIRERRRANCPLGREAKGSDIANVVAFLASEDSGNMTGEIVTCDAGCSCQHMPKDVDF